MHLERLFRDYSNIGRSAEWSFAAGADSIRKWTLLSPADAGLELFSLIALAGCGTRHVESLGKQIAPPFGHLKRPVHLEFVQIRHAPQECGVHQAGRHGGGWFLASEGITPLPKKEARHLDPALRFSSAPPRQGNKGWLVLGYGRRIERHAGTDRFDFEDEHHRLKRCASLFEPLAKLTDPVGFLERLHSKGVCYGRPRSRRYLARLNRELGALLGLSREVWLEPRHDFQRDWEAWAAWQQTLAVLALDVARHVLDASAGLYDPFEQSGVVMLDGLPRGCSHRQLALLLCALDALYPKLQFIVSLSATNHGQVPPTLLSKTLAVPQPLPRPAARKPVRLPPGTALLVDVDGQLPNLALMKLSRFLRNQGKRVVLARLDARVVNPVGVYASCVFASPQSVSRVVALRHRYGAELQIGGSGVDLRKRLPAEIERLDPDYSLYPELGDRAIGFLTRGCPQRCAFCVVPVKEGKPRRVAELDSLLQGRKKLILLDDNLLAHPSAPQILEEMARRDIQTNFNQTLDLRRLTPELAALLRRIRCANVKFTRRVCHFSLNDTRGFELLRRHYGWLQTTSRDHVEFICMYGFNTTLAEDVERFRFLRALPGAYVFLQRYRPALGGPEAKLSRFFDDHAEEQIDALLRVNFTQNMKSMEVYYRWVCLLYAQQRGRVHRPLVETLHRYNQRHRLGAFLVKLEMLCQRQRDGDARGIPFEVTK